jgi:asparagine synthetase A
LSFETSGIGCRVINQRGKETKIFFKEIVAKIVKVIAETNEVIKEKYPVLFL